MNIKMLPLKPRFLFAVLLVATLFLTACINGAENLTEQERGRITTVVSLYTSLLAEGYAHLNLSSLPQVATEGRVTKAYHHMSSLGEARTRMLSTLDRMSFSRVAIISPEKAEVDTEEEWGYTYVDIDSGQETFANRVRYELTYYLLQVGGRWLVDDITIRKAEEEKEPRDSVPFFQRPDDDPAPGSAGVSD